MQLSETIKLYPTKENKDLILKTMDEYIRVVNSLVSDAVKGIPIPSSTAKVVCDLPSALINQCLRDVRSIVKKYYKNCRKTVLKNRKRKLKTTAPKLSVVKKPCFYVNNQNFKVNGNNIEFPVMKDGKCTRISVKSCISDYQKQILSSSKLGTSRVIVKNGKLCIQVVYEKDDIDFLTEGNIMGVDLGIKCPAVSYTSNGKVKFYGNGRKNKYMRRHYAYIRKKLQTSKKINAVKRINNKEQRIMRDIDHKLSHDIVETAVSHNVKVIKLEQLQNIRSTTRTSRKNNHSLHTWSFYRLAQFIEYKARLAGITVEYVNPAFTSQTCPKCGHVHHADDRNYICKCGHRIHRDVLGAINICNSTEYVGKRHTAQRAICSALGRVMAYP